MQRTKREVNVGGRTFVLLRFEQQGNGPAPTDAMIRAAMAEEGLQPLTEAEFEGLYASAASFAGTRTAAFGTLSYGPHERGSILGVLYIRDDGSKGFVENWARADDSWKGEWEFVFAPKVAVAA